MPATRLLVLAPGELTRDPRARRAAVAARERGIDVLGVCGGGEEPVPLEGITVIRTRDAALSTALRRIGLGGMKRERPFVRELRGIFRLFRLALATFRLVRVARRHGPFGLVHANDLDTLPAGWLLARSGRTRLVYDAHELYTMQEPDPPVLHRAVVRRLEGLLARRADAVVTVADPIADDLVHLLRLTSRPIVVLNAPDVVEVDAPPFAVGGRLRAVYQGAMGPGRPLGDLLAAAQTAPSVELTLRIAGVDPGALEREIAERGLTDRVNVAQPVPPDRLVQALAGFDVGLIINRPTTRNDELVLPNKLFEYLMAGLAVAAPRLPALTPIVREAGILFEPGRPESLGALLEELAHDPERLARLRSTAWTLARERYNAAAQTSGYLAAWGLGVADATGAAAASRHGSDPDAARP